METGIFQYMWNIPCLINTIEIDSNTWTKKKKKIIDNELEIVLLSV